MQVDYGPCPVFLGSSSPAAGPWVGCITCEGCAVVPPGRQEDCGLQQGLKQLLGHIGGVLGATMEGPQSPPWPFSPLSHPHFTLPLSPRLSPVTRMSCHCPPPLLGALPPRGIHPALGQGDPAINSSNVIYTSAGGHEGTAVLRD